MPKSKKEEVKEAEVSEQKEPSQVLPQVIPLEAKKDRNGLIVLLITIIAFLLTILAGLLGFWFGSGGKPFFFVSPSPTPTQTATATLTFTPDQFLKNIYKNEKYGYQISFPDSVIITEMDKNAIGLSPEDVAAGKTFESVFAELTSKACVTFKYELGYITIAAPASERYVLCRRSSRAYEGPDKSEEVTIEGKKYKAQGFEEQGPGQTLDYHNETLAFTLENGIRIEYGAISSNTATWNDYLAIKPNLLKILQSLKSI